MPLNHPLPYHHRIYVQQPAMPTRYDEAQDAAIMRDFGKVPGHLERLDDGVERLDDGLAEVKKEGEQHLHDLIERISSLELKVLKLSKIVKLFTQHANTSARAPACLHFVDFP
jgi:hypothetical protein